jgi:hypothetical protein
MWPVIMAHTYFNKICIDSIEGVHHFHADHSGCGPQSNLMKYRVPDQSKITVGISNRQTEKESHSMVIRPANHASVDRITTTNLESLNDIRRFGYCSNAP